MFSILYQFSSQFFIQLTPFSLVLDFIDPSTLDPIGSIFFIMCRTSLLKFGEVPPPHAYHS